MKKILFVALLGLMTAITSMAAIDNTPVSMTIILKNGNTVSYTASNMDSVRFVGGKFGDNGAIGMKIYLKGSESSVDYLYSQITDVIEETQPVVSSNTFIRVTSASQLVAGKRYILVYEGKPAVMGAISNTSTKYGLSVEGLGNFNYQDGVITLTENSDAKPLVLGNTSGAWTFELNGEYLYWSSGNSLQTNVSVSNNSKWTIDIVGNNAVIKNLANSDRQIMFNSDRFACYTGTQQAIQLYVEDVTTANVAAPTFSPAGGTYSSAQNVTISTTTSGATIYYTTDGSAPSATNYAGSGVGSLTVAVTQSITIKAIAIMDGESSNVSIETYTIGTSPDNNVNANWHETLYINANDHNDFTTSRATYGMAWGLEYPHINTGNNNAVVVHATSDYGISLSMEIDKSKRANRWSCFTMYDGVPNNNVGRYGTWKKDPCLPSSAQVDTDEYSDGNYTTNTTNLDGSSTTLFSRGHICASEDRQSLREQNSHTFYTSNCHPQYQQHNSGIWGRMEAKVQDWGYSSSFRDTLYVCKGATIADVVLNDVTTTGTISTTEVYNQFGVNITGTLTIPRYWYMAVLCLKNGEYHAMAFWTEQINSRCNSTTLRSCAISIDELERRTGIDFFCNLPDDIEDAVESASPDLSFWNLTNN